MEINYNKNYKNNKLPQGWVECKLGDIVEYKKGKKPKVLQAEYSEGLLPYVDIKCFEKNIIENYTNSDDGVLIDNKNILVVWDGARAGFCGSYNNRGILGSTIMALRPLLVNKKLIEYFIQSKFQILNKQTKGTGIPHVKPDLFWNFLFKLPPLNEQKRIVEKIEEEFGKIDEGVEKLKSAQEQIKQYRQSVLKSAFEGKLYKTTEWEEKTLGQVIFPRRERITPNNNNGEMPFIGMDCIKPNSLTIHEQYRLKDTKSVSFVFYENDVLYGRMRSYLNKVWQATFDGAASAEFIVFPENENIIGTYLKYLLHNQSFVKYATRNASGDRPRVKFEADLADYKLRLPTLDEQKQIVKEIEMRFEVADEVERVIAENLEKAEQLKQSILKKAFEGRLVPQDPTDQPASKLLAKIQAERKK